MDTRRRAEEVFEAALELEPSARPAYVARVCALDGALLQQVMALLGAHERADGILEVDVPSLMRPDTAPERLGVYRVLREIGRGGMGVVYEGERADGQFVRRVAIKVLRSDSDPSVRQRVLAERQILAALDHPNIARLLDGGVTPDGRPYLVMEHVDGLPVDVYCDRMRLTISERLRLFIIIARAVAYAHRNLVVHRDLKPSNILITAEGQVKLLDFGIAKLLNPAMGGVATHTLHDRLALTPEYASPEQLRGDSLTTLSDIYSLGVLLYELLTGRRPFAAAGLTPLLQAVAETEPERPSTRVTRQETVALLDGGTRAVEPAVVARARHSTPVRLARTLRGDLDAIVTTALRKEPPGRYGSAELFAADLERFLDGLPVQAQRRGRGYAFGKLVRRHRFAAGAVALAFLSLSLGAAVALWQAAAARDQRDQAEAAREEAVRVTNFMVDLFSAGAPGEQLQGAVTARDLIRRGTARIDALAAQPLVQARLLGALARAYEGLGDYEAGQRLTQRALTVYGSQQQHAAATVAALLLQHGILQRRRSEFDSAQATFFAARAAIEDGPSSPELHGSILQQLASIAVYRGDLIEAERRISEAFEQQSLAFGETSRVTVNTLSYYATVQWRRGRLEAETLFRRVIELRPQVPGYTRVELMTDQMALATMLVSEARRLDEAERICRDVIAATPPDAANLISLAIWSRHLLAVILEQRGAFAEVERLRNEDLAIRRAMHGEVHPGIAESLITLAKFVMQQGRYTEAETYFEQAEDIVLQSVGERHALYAALLIDVGWLHLNRGDARTAETFILRGIELREQLSGRTMGAYVTGLRLLALAKTQVRDYAAAEQLLNSALEIVARQEVAGGRDHRLTHDAFATLYTAWGRRADAARHRALSRPLPIPT